MPAPTEIATSQLARLIGTPDAPRIIDVRVNDDYEADPRMIPGSERFSHTDCGAWAGRFKGQSVVVSCQKGLKLSHGVAAWLRHEGIEAEALEGGFEAWRHEKQSLVPASVIPPKDSRGRTVWVTRERPKIDRIACPWLIKRFIDPEAVFLFVRSSEVEAVAQRFDATPFDIEGVHWSHRGELCTFDVMIKEFGLAIAPLLQLAGIVRGADTGRLDLVPEAAGLLAVSLGLSRMYRDDLAQLQAGLMIYDAFYRWCRDATGETHNWPNPQSGRREAMR